MGSALCCLNSADSRSSAKKTGNTSTERASLRHVAVWKKQLGFTEPLKFDYPSTVTHKSFRQIDKDISRTFPSSSYFTSDKHQELFAQTLKKVAVYFPRVGYTQGMNFIVGLLLMEGGGSPYAFTIFTKMATHPDLMVLGLYEDEFPLNRFYCELVWKIVHKKNPRICSKVKSLGIIDELWVFQWFMAFFIISFPLEVVTEFLTYIFSHKKLSLPKLAAAIILALGPRILAFESEVDLFDLLEQLKEVSFWRKNLREDEIMKEAGLVGEGELWEIITKEMSMPTNRYWQYFKEKETNRKIVYLRVMDGLKEDRRMFLENPDKPFFERSDLAISVLDEIEKQALKRMSLSVAPKKVQHMRLSGFQPKMWQSDLHTRLSPIQQLEADRRQ